MSGQKPACACFCPLAYASEPVCLSIGDLWANFSQLCNSASWCCRRKQCSVERLTNHDGTNETALPPSNVIPLVAAAIRESAVPSLLPLGCLTSRL
jgi:hypothetical protein